MGRIFTPAEATRTLPLVRQIVGDVLERGRALIVLRRRDELSDEDEEQAARLASELEDLLHELEQVGCTFRSPDFQHGLIDFPGIIEGRLVHLCWRDDEPDLRWYHEPAAGFAGRKPIPPELFQA